MPSPRLLHPRLGFALTTLSLVALTSAGTALLVAHGTQHLAAPSALAPNQPPAQPSPGPLVVGRAPGTPQQPVRTVTRVVFEPAVLRSVTLAAVPVPAVPVIPVVTQPVPPAAAPPPTTAPAPEPAPKPSETPPSPNPDRYRAARSTPAPAKPTPHHHDKQHHDKQRHQDERRHADKQAGPHGHVTKGSERG